MISLLFYPRGRTSLGTGPRALPYPVAIPHELVRPSESSWGLARWRVGTLFRKIARKYHHVACFLIRLGVPSLHGRGSFLRATSLAPQGAGLVGISLGPSEMLQKPVLGKPSTALGELENQAHYPGGPRGINTPSFEPQTKGLHSFYRQTVVGNTSC